MFAKKHKKPVETTKSINFADSLASELPTPGIQAPDYQSANKSNSTSKTAATSDTPKKGAFQTEGSITFYCNGFLLERDILGNNQRKRQADQDADGNGEVMHEESSTIKKGETYWSGMENKLEERFTGKEPNADSTFYFDGSAGPLSSAKDRMTYGQDAAKIIIKQVESGQFALDDNGVIPAVINVVGHSMGAAYAAGLANGLLAYNDEKGKKIFNVKAVYYFAPHQPMDIEHPSQVRGVQYSHKRDTVSSDGNSSDPLALWGALPNATGSKLGPINGIHEYMVHDTPGLSQSLLGDRGGHSMIDHEYTLDKYKEGREGYVAPNADTDYDSENYRHQAIDNSAYERRDVHLPQLIDKLQSLPSDIRTKIDDIKNWINDNVNDANSTFKEKVFSGKDWLDDKRERGKDWVDEKIDDGSEWLDDKISKGDEKVDREIVKATGWLKKKSGGLLNGGIEDLSDWVRGKKDDGVDWTKAKKDKGADYAQDNVEMANDWLKDKSGDAVNWVTEMSDSLNVWANDEVTKIADWAKNQLSKGERHAKKVAKRLRRKLEALIKKIQRRIQKIKDRATKIITIIKEAKQWS